MATEADLIQKFKDLNIPVGTDFEELIHEAFTGANLVDKVENHDSRIATVEDNLDATKGSIQSNTNQIATKVAHLSGANNFDTVPTVNNNPLLLASSLPSDLARTGSDQEFTGKNTFDTAPIDKATGNSYITKDGVPAVPSTLADTTKDTNFTGKLQKSGIDVATTTDVTNAVNTATANMADTTKPANFTAGLQSGGIDVATAADLKSVEASAWRELDLSGTSGVYKGKMRIKIDDANKTIYLDGAMYFPNKTSANKGDKIIDLSQVVNKLTSAHGYLFFMSVDSGDNTYANITNPNLAESNSSPYSASTIAPSGASIIINSDIYYLNSDYFAKYVLPFPDQGKESIYVTYDSLK